MAEDSDVNIEMHIVQTNKKFITFTTEIQQTGDESALCSINVDASIEM
jgi:hypothetical protein